jgi:thioredoxin reductase
LIERGFSPVVFEAGASVGSSLESFRHVQLFSPWRYNVDPAARRLLEATGWTMPPEAELPTAGAMIDRYLAPLAALPAVAAALRLSHRVVGISRDGFDKVKSRGREEAPFVIRTKSGVPPGGKLVYDTIYSEHRAWAVIDATGTWAKPNPLGANGLPAIGELEAGDYFAYGMPDILGRARERYAGKRVLVAGAGHSAAGNLLALAKLAEAAPGTEIVWTIRGHNFARIFGGGENDGLPARGALGKRLKALADSGRMRVEADFLTTAIRQTSDGLVVEGRGGGGEPRRIERIDEVVVATGGRPDLSLFSELRVKLDPWVESTEQLAPLIDPNVHSCGTVRPHGHRELTHPEPRFYAVGSKSYGRAPNFLLATGHEQVRSVAAVLAGDLAAADEVRLELPETGVCSTQFDEASSGCCTPKVEKPAAAKSACCGGPPKSRADACCAKDEKAKDAGKSGCGCGTSPKVGEVASADA